MPEREILMWREKLDCYVSHLSDEDRRIVGSLVLTALSLGATYGTSVPVTEQGEPALTYLRGMQENTPTK